MQQSQHPIERMVTKVQMKAQKKTCHPSKRPYGVGILIGGVDKTGTHLFETCPSANYYEYKAMAIGAKCQSAKTYLERNYESFSGLDGDALIAHGVKAMKASAQDTDLTEHNLSIGVLGRGQDFKTLSKEELRAVLGAAGGDEQMQVN